MQLPSGFEMTWRVMVYRGLESRHFHNALNGWKADIPLGYSVS